MTKGARLRFGAFEADLETGELWRDGVRVRLQQQPFRLLALLVDRPGELVTREEMRTALWPSGTYVAFERGLTSAIRKVREALGDRADAPRFVETLPGRGYRFIAPVTRERPAVPEMVTMPDLLQTVPALAPAKGAWRREFTASRIRAVLLAAVTLLAGVRGEQTTPAPERLAAAEALSQYACLLKSQGRYAEGLEVIERAHALVPQSARFTAEVGFHLHAVRQYDAEMRMLQLAVSQDARSAEAWLHLGLGYARREQFGNAVHALERASTLAHGDQRIAYWMTWARSQDTRRPS